MGESSQCGRVPEGRGGSVGGGRVGGRGGGVQGGVGVGTNPNFRYKSTHSGKQRIINTDTVDSAVLVKFRQLEVTVGKWVVCQELLKFFGNLEYTKIRGR